ncbi:MAG: stage III sporulation protein AC [Clostridia bacterium]|nr:stage III sporulation protein AC [Clostridia bacterium]
MDIDFVFKIAAIGMLVTVLQQVLSRAGRDDIATLTTLSGLVIVLLMVMNLVSDFFSSVKAIFQLY